MRGTRGFVTTPEESTGSVGDSNAPSRNASVQDRSVRAFAAPATMSAVSGIASTSLRAGRCQAVRSISSSTSRPSRKRITTSAVTARISTKPEPAREVEHADAALAEDEADDDEDRRQGQEAATGETGQERPEHEQPAEDGRGGLEVGHGQRRWLLRCTTRSPASTTAARGSSKRRRSSSRATATTGPAMSSARIGPALVLADLVLGDVEALADRA